MSYPEKNTIDNIGNFKYKDKVFNTYSSLSIKDSAFHTFILKQKIFIVVIIIAISVLTYINWHLMLVLFISIVSCLYFLDLVFNLFLTLKSIHKNPELNITDKDLSKIDNNKLPIYTILCPLYKETGVLSGLITALENIDWPKTKLEVILLLEEDDKTTQSECQKLSLPDYFKIIQVPQGQPKTKPKALNYGLKFTRGDLLVVYDAEDRPDPKQLKKAYLAFQKLGNNNACIQAKLNYYNPEQNLLTRLFTAEYSLWFEIMLPGLRSIKTVIPLGGTSNHLKTHILKQLHGWDSFNVTEDADLGVRLFKSGYQTAIINSITLEEANSDFTNWIKQRTRWLKGYLQTILVSIRYPLLLIKQLGIHAFILQLVMGLRIVFMVINPILWLMTFAYFALNRNFGLFIESLYITWVFYLAAAAMVFGNFMYLYNYMIGCYKTNQFRLIKYVFFIPFYWLAISIAAARAFWQLVFNPFQWEKTRHGLIKSDNKVPYLPGLFGFSIKPAFSLNRQSLSSLILVVALIWGNFANFLYNIFLGRNLTLTEFGLVSLLSNLTYFIQIISDSINKSVTYKTGFLSAKYNDSVQTFRLQLYKNVNKYVVILTGLWLLMLPVLAIIFKEGNLWPFIALSPFISLGLYTAINSGFLNGNLKFVPLSFIIFVEPTIKLLAAAIFVYSGLGLYAYLSLPVSVVAVFILAWIFAEKQQSKIQIPVAHLTFPKKYFSSVLTSKLAAVAFLTLDILLAKHYLSPEQAGKYALLSVVGKMVFFAGSLFSSFTIPIVSKKIGAGQNPKPAFKKIMFLSLAASFFIYFVFCFSGEKILFLLFGGKAAGIISFIPLYLLAMVIFSQAANFYLFFQVQKEYLLSVINIFLALLQIAGMAFWHQNIIQLVNVMLIVSILNLSGVIIGHLFYTHIRWIFSNLTDFFGLFTRIFPARKVPVGFKVLIFNWRDTRHKWSGGAEVYIHEMAKNWTKQGIHVTWFCGNDGNCPRYEKLDGIEIVRRGGFYTVYLWAMLYYIFRFRGRFNAIIDSENGIPFFTPVYVGKPKYLLIHHVHQEYLRNHVPFPMSQIARVFESRLMPFIYQNQTFITVSESSRNDLIKYGIADLKNIEVVKPGVNGNNIKLLNKTLEPSFLYLGRLKPYKNVDIAIKAFAEISNKYPLAGLTIAGDGECKKSLKKLVNEFSLEQKIHILGKVSENQKEKLLSKSWVMLQPSSFEGWGLTVIEANAAGTPVIAAYSGGLKDAVVNNITGFLVKPKNVTLLAYKMELFINSPIMRKEMSTAAYTWSQNFSWEKSAERFLQIITHKKEKGYGFRIKPEIAVAKK